MSTGLGAFVTDSLLYLLLVGSGATAIVSTIFLIVKGKVLSKTAKLLILALITAGLSIALYLIYLAVAFGHNHPSAFPVPLQ